MMGQEALVKVCILSSVHMALDNRVFYREARSLQRAGFAVTVLAVHDREEVKDGIQITGLPRVPRWKRPLLWLTLLRSALRTDADVYHFHDPELLLVTPWLHWLTGKPTIYDIHETYADFIEIKEYLPRWLRTPTAWIFRWLEPLLARLQSGLIFADDEIGATFEAVKRPKVTLFNYPERTLVEQATATIDSTLGREPVILYLGSIERARGTRLMVEAFHLVRQRMPDARLLLVGHFAPEDLEHEVRAHARRLGLQDAIQITGRVPFETIGSFLRQAAVGWIPFQPVPKYLRNIPTKLFEYMAYGVPIVSSDLPTTRPFMAKGKSGYLVPAEDPAAHAEAILHILSHPDQAASMGRQGQELVLKEYNWSQMESRLLELYDELLPASRIHPTTNQGQSVIDTQR
jgi:glycosyltransferase involved in cell wall biosynthesis